MSIELTQESSIVIVIAFISGAWSLISLVVSKDQKITEFRQDWINNLRNEVAAYIGFMSSISTSWLYHSDTVDDETAQSRFINDNVERMKDLNDQRVKILLRLNRNEHERVITILADLDRKLTPKKIIGDDFHRKLDELELEVQILLKKEWNRVKKGEAFFYITKNLTIIFTILFFFWLCVYLANA